MRAYRRTSGFLGILTAVALVGCASNLPESTASTGGTGAPAQTGTGGTGGVVTVGSGGAAGLAMTATGGAAGRSAVPDSHRASAAACEPEPDAGLPTSTDA